MSTNLNDTTPAAPAGGVNVKWQTDGSGNDSAYAPASGYFPIAEVIQVANTPTMTFTGIPAGYRNLKVLITARTDDGNPDLYLQFNGDTGVNYNSVVDYAGSSSGSVTMFGVAQASCGSSALSTAPSGEAAVSEITIFDYARTAWNKSATVLSGRFDSGSAGFSLRYAFTWLNTAAITSIVIGKQTGAGNLVIGTVATLYGTQ